MFKKKFFLTFLLLRLFNIRMSQKFCNILVCASLWHVYHVTKAVQAMEGTLCSW